MRTRKKARTFYKMNPDFRLGGAPGLQLENKHLLLQGRRTVGPPVGQRGFPEYPEAPRFLFDKRLGRHPRDVEEYHAYWLVSDRAKVVLETVDPDGVAFARCDVVFPTERKGRFIGCAMSFAFLTQSMRRYHGCESNTIQWTKEKFTASWAEPISLSRRMSLAHLTYSAWLI